jgi:hypothetical protein
VLDGGDGQGGDAFAAAEGAEAFVGGRYYLEGPDGGPEWGLRAGLVLLFPK